MTRRARVVFVITRLNVGGPGLHVMLLRRGLDPERYDTTVVAGVPTPSEGSLPDLLRDDAPALVVPSLGRSISPLADVAAFVRLVRLFRRIRPDVVHTHMAKAGALGRLAARLAGVPVVVHTFHGNVFRGYFGAPASRAFVLAERFLARFTGAIVAISPGQARELAALGIATPPRLVEIPLGIDLRPFSAPRRGALRAELGVGPGAPLIGLVARLVPVKGVEVFLDAAAILAGRVPQVRFAVVGDGELRTQLEARARSLGIAERTGFLGWRADLASLYVDLDVIALTSHNEGTPTSVIEAMAAGVPVVATAVGGVPDLVGSDAGLLVPDGDSAALADAIAAVLADGAKRQAIIAAGRRRARDFDQVDLIRRVDALYQTLLTRVGLR